MRYCSQFPRLSPSLEDFIPEPKPSEQKQKKLALNEFHISAALFSERQAGSFPAPTATDGKRDKKFSRALCCTIAVDSFCRHEEGATSQESITEQVPACPLCWKPQRTPDKSRLLNTQVVSAVVEFKCGFLASKQHCEFKK